MSHLQYFDQPGAGEEIGKMNHYSQALRIDNRIEISGQAGLDPQTSEVPKNLGKEIDLAFANVEAALKAAGGKGWEQVYKVRSYHIPLDEEALEHTVRNLKKYTPNHRPLVTVVGVTSLAIPGMRIEIEVEADVR